MREKVLETERLWLGKWTAEDFHLVWELFGNPVVTALVGGPFTEQHVRGRLEGELASMRELGTQYYPIFLKGGEEFVGCCGLKSRPTPKANHYEMGYYLLPQYNGKGYATEAARGVIRHAFEALGAEALYAGHHPLNSSSRNVLLKLGFSHCCEELYPPTGLIHPLYNLERPRQLQHQPAELKGE